MAKLTLYGREMEVVCTMPTIYVTKEDDLIFLKSEIEKLCFMHDCVASSGYKTDGSLNIELQGAVISACKPPEQPDFQFGNYPWALSPQHLYSSIEISVDWGVFKDSPVSRWIIGDSGNIDEDED